VQQEASTALIVAIVAVVLGALGLIGGVIGYVQGTAALRRATLIRQRAAAAEEAALQAKLQTEQAVRTTQSLLDRFNGVGTRAIDDVADLPTGPLVLPPRAVPALPAVDGFAAPPVPAPSSARTSSLPMPDWALQRDPEPEPASPFARPSTGPVWTGSDIVPPTAGPAPEADTGSIQLAPSTGPIATDAAEPAPSSGTAEIEPSAGVTSLQTETVSRPADEAEPAAEPRRAAEAEPVLDDEPPPDGETAPAAGAASEPDPAPDEEGVVPPQRSSTGQVNAAPRGISPMDWAEVLRTGAIPLPSRSRGTYAAPPKAKGQPMGPARFEIRAVGRQKYEAVNVGGVTAEQAVVEGAGDDRHLVRPVETRAKSVAPGASVAFSVLRVEGRQVSVHLSWMAGGDDAEVELPVP
jgi:hypothetical protein